MRSSESRKFVSSLACSRVNIFRWTCIALGPISHFIAVSANAIFSSRPNTIHFLFVYIGSPTILWVYYTCVGLHDIDVLRICDIIEWASSSSFIICTEMRQISLFKPCFIDPSKCVLFLSSSNEAKSNVFLTWSCVCAPVREVSRIECCPPHSIVLWTALLCRTSPMSCPDRARHWKFNHVNPRGVCRLVCNATSFCCRVLSWLRYCLPTIVLLVVVMPLVVQLSTFPIWHLL